MDQKTRQDAPADGLVVLSPTQVLELQAQLRRDLEILDQLFEQQEEIISSTPHAKL